VLLANSHGGQYAPCSYPHKALSDPDLARYLRIGERELEAGIIISRPSRLPQLRTGAAPRVRLTQESG
jgi:hypothetical protein